MGRLVYAQGQDRNRDENLVGGKNGQKSREPIRRLARGRGYVIRKSRARKYLHSDNCGRYMLIEPNRNVVVLGERFDARLDDIETFIDKSYAA